MIDSRLVGASFREPTVWTGRWAGANTGTPTAVAKTTQRATISRSGVGTLSVTLNDANPPATTGGLVGIVQSYAFSVASSNATSPRVVQVTPPTANSAVFTVQLYKLDYANATMAAVDISSTEELVMTVWTARADTP